jgi:protein translocase, SecG subunit
MMVIIIGIHVVVCFLLICMILVQSGRGGGLIESFSGMESVFGTKPAVYDKTDVHTLCDISFDLSYAGPAFGAPEPVADERGKIGPGGGRSQD